LETGFVFISSSFCLIGFVSKNLILSGAAKQAELLRNLPLTFAENVGETPVLGDWNGDGRTKIGVYLRGFWALDFNGNGRSDAPDRFFALGGQPGEHPSLGPGKQSRIATLR